MPPTPTTRLRVISRDDDALRQAVLGLAPAADQEIFSSRAAVTLPEADADPCRLPFAVTSDGTPVGFGVLDRGGYLPELVDDAARAVLLRAFYVDAAAQGRGTGSRAARLVRGLAGTLPGAELVVLTVNVENPAAVRAYRRAGYADTGARYLGGSAGPQHVLVAAVTAEPSAV